VRQRVNARQVGDGALVAQLIVSAGSLRPRWVLTPLDKQIQKAALLHADTELIGGDLRSITGSFRKLKPHHI
jgi:hypothetical protein